MRALVTGAAGFIGSRLVDRLLADGAEVVGLDACTPYYDPDGKRSRLAVIARHPRGTAVEADLLDDGWQHHLDAVDVVFHLAAQPGVRTSWGTAFREYADNNVVATQRLLEAVRARAGGPEGLRRFVYASSSSIYGDALHHPTREDTTPRPVSPYGITKLAGEHLCSVYAHSWGVPTVALRYFTVFGGGQRPDMALARMIRAARGGPAFPLFGTGEQRRDLTHVDDVVSANVAAVTADVAPGSVLNVAGGSDVSVGELLDLVAELAGRTVEVEQHPAQPGDVNRTGAATDRADRMLGWRPRVALRDGVAEQVAAWYRGEPR